ncbi:uncharacterized protein N7473_010326 [Penicillium subrubescens]|uniref:uncharacterized protein n=1 Tax=Penicillium subrubescens TaxID=1316194 RepID=UPI0025457524|nr:uncharacterized protein N7473_010326 [Penicillium subrubescens]KAJ5883440.1 hypothetical protein N7473_010326 [Penicillium subrubescens]
MGSTFSPRVDPEGGISYEPLETRYVRMILEADKAPWQYNLLASGAHWVLLAGYLVIPGTFTSLQKSDTLHNTLSDNEAGEIILKSIQNPPLLALASVFFVVGLALLGRLYYEYRSNYIWLINRIFMYVTNVLSALPSVPTLLNSSAGLLTTMVSLYTGHGGDWSIMALLTVIVSSLSVASSFFLLIVYKLVKLEEVKREHDEIHSARHHFLHS